MAPGLRRFHGIPVGKGYIPKGQIRDEFPLAPVELCLARRNVTWWLAVLPLCAMPVMRKCAGHAPSVECTDEGWPWLC